MPAYKLGAGGLMSSEGGSRLRPETKERRCISQTFSAPCVKAVTRVKAFIAPAAHENAEDLHSAPGRSSDK